MIKVVAEGALDKIECHLIFLNLVKWMDIQAAITYI